jgi:hypothetical protein
MSYYPKLEVLFLWKITISIYIYVKHVTLIWREINYQKSLINSMWIGKYLLFCLNFTILLLCYFDKNLICKQNNYQAILYIKFTMSVYLSVCPGSFQALLEPLFFCFFVFWWVLFFVSVKLSEPFFFRFFVFFDGFCFLCQLNCPDLCFFVFFLMGFVFCDSYYSTGALCTRFTLVCIKKEPC